jgi:hypothetical protein
MPIVTTSTFNLHYMMKKSYLVHLSIVVIGTLITFGISASGYDNSTNRATLQQNESRNSLKIDPLTKSIQVSLENPRKATVVTRIRQGMSYQEARKILIQQGWQPNLSTSNREIPNLEDNRIKSIYDSGYKEIKDCSGTGLGLCGFEFTNSKGELLVVSTAQEELVVFHWFLDPPSKAIQVGRRNLPKDTGVRDIKQRMPYGAARKILIEQGWQPNIPMSTGDLLNLEKNKMVKIVYDRGYGEIKDCSKTGLRLCRFEFVNYKSELLVILATSLPELKVSHWFIRRYAK